jgi:hypothetical protein
MEPIGRGGTARHPGRAPRASPRQREAHLEPFTKQRGRP